VPDLPPLHLIFSPSLLQVGYAIRCEDCTSDKTFIKYMTDGVLLLLLPLLLLLLLLLLSPCCCCPPAAGWLRHPL
jgi:hypothetical protein